MNVRPRITVALALHCLEPSGFEICKLALQEQVYEPKESIYPPPSLLYLCLLKGVLFLFSKEQLGSTFLIIQLMAWLVVSYMKSS